MSAGHFILFSITTGLLSVKIFSNLLAYRIDGSSYAFSERHLNVQI